MAMSSGDEYSASDTDSEPQMCHYRPSNSENSLLGMFARQRELAAAQSGVRGAKRLSLFHGNDGALILPEKTVRTRGWTPGSKLVAGPASGLVRCRVLLKKEQFDKEWWSAHVEQVALAKKMCEAHEANIRRHGCRPAEYVSHRQEGRLSRRRQANIDHKARVDALRIAADKVQVEFEETFSWEERKLIVAQAYFNERLALAEETGVISCSWGHAIHLAARAGGVAYSTAEDYIRDHINNGGWFSPSLWGTNRKTPSMVGDIDTKRWARQWVIDCMGHRTGVKNKYAKDFNEALHHKLGLEWDPLHPVICEAAARTLLKSTGAVFTETRQGYTHCDNHGADHVVNSQRPAFLDLYKQLYLRGPNFLQVGTEIVDKDIVIGTSATWELNHHLLDHESCKGPRGIHMGGAVNPANAATLLPFCKGIDFPGRIWHISCHDECCVHALKGERGCWLIPGVDMGDIPPKSDGEYEHLAENDVEMQGGTLSLTLQPGQISREDMRKYIAAKRARQVDYPVPHYSSVRMHAGAGAEGSWFGDDAKDHFELIIDIFDLVFNMPWVQDPTKATVGDLLAVTKQQREAFKHGLAVQGDRSQGHLKMSKDCINANKIKKRPGGGQPHFRHTFVPLPQRHPDLPQFTHWSQCRHALCTPGCEECQAAVTEHGDRPDFMSIGRKGSDRVLLELGYDVAHLKVKEQAALLKTLPGWELSSRKSQVQELFEERGHFFLIGAACHAELAHKEHGWARLKREVKPYVDGKLTTLRALIAAAIGKIGMRERILDAARCRRVMMAYLICAAKGETATADRLQLWERAHKKHRDLHLGELASLQQQAGLTVAEVDARMAAKIKTTQDMKDKLTPMIAKFKKQLMWTKRSAYNKRPGSDPVKKKFDAKARVKKWQARVAAGDVHRDRGRVRARRKI